jgi:hypothetical protein
MTDDAFAPPASAPGWDADGDRPVGLDVHVHVVVALLVVTGVPLLGIAVLEAVALPLAFSLDPTMDQPLSGVLGLFAGCLAGGVYGVMGLVPLLAAVGLEMRRLWGFVLALVAFTPLVASPCCLPVGVYALWALLRAPVRQAYGLS